jgi:hypothetical protein
MSEPLSTDEIEDVVSSVRRLVSPEARPRPVSRDLGQDRLLLTPALRVIAEPDVAEPEPADLLMLNVRAVEPEGPAAAVTPELDKGDAPAEPEPADLLMLNVRADASEGHADTVAPAVAAEAPLAAADMALPEPEATAEFLHVVDSEWEDAFWSEPEPALAELALGAEEAELVQADDVILPEAEVQPAAWVQADESWAQDGPVPFVAIHHRNAAAEVDGLAPEPVAAVNDSAEAAPAETSTAEAAPAEAALPDASVQNSFDAETYVPEVVSGEAAVSETIGATAVDLMDGVEDLALDPAETKTEDTSVEAAPSGLAATGMTEVLTDKDGNPVTVLDEDALSQIVRLLIREELQGVLGERITQNVRKLVRAEINRALTAQSLD